MGRRQKNLVGWRVLSGDTIHPCGELLLPHGQGRDSGGHRQEVDAKTVVGRWDARGVSSVPCTRVQTIIGEKTELGVGWEDFLLIPTADATRNTNDEMCMAVLLCWGGARWETVVTHWISWDQGF